MNHALLFGDGFTGDESDPDRYNRYTMGFRGGAGRMRLFWWPGGLGSWNSYRTRSPRIVEGETYEWPMRSNMPINSQMTGAKLAMTIPHGGGPVPRFTFRVVDKCPPEGDFEVIRTASVTDGTKKRIRLDNPSTEIHGRCLYAQVIGENVNSGGRVVHAGSILYSQNPDLF